MRAMVVPIAIACAGLMLACGSFQPHPQKVEPTGCQYDAQCKADRVCEKHTCVAGPPAAKPVPEPEPSPRPAVAMATIGDCYEGNIQDCYDMGMKWVFGIEGPEDPGQARAYFHKACQGGHIFGCMMLGLLLEEKSGEKGENGDAKCKVYEVEHYEKECEDGDGDACYNAARLLDGGSPYKPERDKKRARKLYKEACEVGVDKACKKKGKKAEK